MGSPGFPCAQAPALFFICGDRVPHVQGINTSSPMTASYSSDVFRTALGSDSDGGRTGILCNTGATECSNRGMCCHAYLPSSGNFTDDTGVALEYTVTKGGKTLECGDRDFGGCVCDQDFDGEFCEVALQVAGGRRTRGDAFLVLFAATSALILSIFSSR